MSTITRTLVQILAGLALVAALSSCGTSDDAGGGTPSATESSTASATEVVSVSLRRTGGLKPVTVTRQFSADAAPPEGFSPADVDRVLRVANAFVASGAVPKPLPANTCCDRYVYTVTLGYADGSSDTFETIDGQRQPPAFQTLVQALS